MFIEISPLTYYTVLVSLVVMLVGTLVLAEQERKQRVAFKFREGYALAVKNSFANVINHQGNLVHPEWVPYLE